MNISPAVTPAELSALLDDFRHFLGHNWPHRPTWDDGCWQEMSAEEEWTNSHWEVLVEYPLRLRFGDEFFLGTYGYPGDNEYRVWRPDEWATHTIIVNRDYVFQSFWSGKQQPEMERPTFHLVVAEPIKDEEDWLVAPFEVVELSLEPCEYVERE